MPEYRAFTALFDEIAEELTSPVNVWSELITGSPSNTSPLEITALWDTGATGTCIKPWLKNKLNLRLFTSQALLAGVGEPINNFV